MIRDRDRLGLLKEKDVLPGLIVIVGPPELSREGPVAHVEERHARLRDELPTAVEEHGIPHVHSFHRAGVPTSRRGPLNPGGAVRIQLAETLEGLGIHVRPYPAQRHSRLDRVAVMLLGLGVRGGLQDDVGHRTLPAESWAVHHDR